MLSACDDVAGFVEALDTALDHPDMTADLAELFREHLRTITVEYVEAHGSADVE